MNYLFRIILLVIVMLSLSVPVLSYQLPNVPLSGFDSYSYNETLTNKVWVNGKLIYRKVIDLGALPNNSIKYVPHGITGVTQWISLVGMERPSDGRIYGTPINFWNLQPSALMGMYVSPTDIVVHTAGDRTTDIAFAVVEYTKD